LCLQEISYLSVHNCSFWNILDDKQASLSMYKVYSLALPYISSHVHYLCPFVYGCLVVLLHFLEHELLVYWKRGNSCGLIDTCP